MQPKEGNASADHVPSVKNFTPKLNNLEVKVQAWWVHDHVQDDVEDKHLRMLRLQDIHYKYSF